MLGEEPGVGTLGFRAAIAAQARLLLGLLPDAAAIDAGRLAEQLHAESVRIVRRNRPVLERLARRYALGVVSNFTGNLEPCLAELGVLELFAVALDSTVVGIAKPDERIFVRALERLEVRAPDAWMVGDNVDADLRPAQRLGLRTCWVAPPGRPSPGDFAPTTRISRLTELERAVA